MKTLVHICAAIAVISIGVILVAWHLMTRNKNRDKTEAAREARWKDKPESKVETADPEFKTPVNNGQSILTTQSQ